MQDDVAERLRQLPEEVQQLFTHTKHGGTPDSITRAGCVALAALGKEAWNAWREAFPAKDRLGNPYKNNANFSGVSFSDEFYFSGRVFLEEFDFSDFNFGHSARFDGAEFGYFSLFDNASFGQGATFKEAVFGGRSSFRHCRGGGRVNFSQTKWKEKASFEYSELSIDFSDSKFMSKVSFSYCQLTRADFSSAQFDENVSFIGCSVEKEISFRGAIFAKGADFSNTQFKGRTDFSEAKFEKVPLFHGCEIHQDTSFEGATFPAATGDEEAERAYRTLKLAFSKHQAIREEQRFFRLEMAEETLRQKGIKRKLFELYEKHSDYGFSLMQPCKALLFIFVFMAVIYGLPSLFGQTCQEACTFSPQWLSFTLLQSLPILGMEKQVWDLRSAFWPTAGRWDAALIFLVAIHKTLSLVAFFLIGLALRNLFKLK